MRLGLSLLAASAITSVGMSAFVPAQSTADSHAHPPAPAATSPMHERGVGEASLRALAARVGLRVGVAVDAAELGSNEKYTRVVARDFSTVTPENAMKWAELEPTRGTFTWTPADEIVAFAGDHRQLVRGHTLVWHNQLPAWLSTDGVTTAFSASELKAILKEHIQDEVRHFRGRIWQWDVVNEAFNDDGTPRQTIWYPAWRGMGYVADAFRWAHQADPDAKLYYNDYNLEFTGPKSDAVYDFLKRLKRRGVPVDGVGFQGHLDTQYGFPDLQDNLRRFGGLGLEVAVTEADVRTFTKPAPDINVPVSPVAQSAQEHYWSRRLQGCLLVRQCVSFTVWGVGDAYSWIPGWFHGEGAALLLDENLEPKPQYDVVRDDLRLAAGSPRDRG